MAFCISKQIFLSQTYQSFNKTVTDFIREKHSLFSYADMYVCMYTAIILERFTCVHTYYVHVCVYVSMCKMVRSNVIVLIYRLKYITNIRKRQENKESSHVGSEIN